MSTDPAVTLYRRWLKDVWERGDLAAAAEVLAADLVDHDAMPGMPPGRAGHDLVLGMIRAAFPDAIFTCDVVFAAGDLVAGRWTMDATHTGPLAMTPGLPPTGRRVRMHGQEIFRVVDGKLAEIWHQESVMGLMAQLGVMGGPPPG